MISNANPWDNLKFDVDGIVEVKRKFFGTLYNTYSFLAPVCQYRRVYVLRSGHSVGRKARN